MSDQLSQRIHHPLVTGHAGALRPSAHAHRSVVRPSATARSWRPALALVAFALSATNALAAPVAGDDSYAVNANGLLTVSAAAGLLSNDSGANPNPPRMENAPVTSQYGARVAVNADGSFSYDPPTGFVGVDSFVYTVRDASGASSAVVTIDVSGQVVWFVDDSAAAGGDGSFGSPFNSLTSVNGANGVGDVDAVGETIFVYAGSYTVEFDVEAGQRFLGEANGLDLVGTANDVAPGARPSLSGASSFPVIEFFGAGASARGFDISALAGRGLSGSSVSNVTAANIGITVSGSTTGGVLFNGTSGTITLDDVDVTGTGGIDTYAYLFISNSGTVNFVGSSVSGFSGGHVLNVSGNGGTVSLDSTSDLSSSNTRGLSISTLGATGVVTLAGVNLGGGRAGEPLVYLLNNNATSVVNFEEGVNINATTTDSHAFSATGGKIKIAGTASTLSAADGAALDLDTIEFTQTATFASLASTSSPAHGVNVASPVGANGISVTGTTSITAPTTGAITVEDSASPSGFVLSLNTLNASGGIHGIRVLGAGVTVSNAASTVAVSAGIGLYCENATLNASLASLTVGGGNSAATFLTCAGTVSALGGNLTSLAGLNNHVVFVSTSTINFSFAGAINKADSGRAVQIDGLTAPGAVSLSGVTTAGAGSGGVLIQNSTRPVNFGTLTLGSGAARFATTPVTLAGNTGAVDLGVFSSYVNGSTGLDIAYANPSPGLVTTRTGSVIDVSGAATALRVSHATNQPLSLSIASISSTGAGSHGIDINRASGAMVVSGLVNLGAKTVAGVQISNSSLVTSITKLDITGANDGVRLSNNSGSFTIFGDGNFVSSHTNGFGGTFTNLTDNAFDLNNVLDVRANDVTISGTGSHGVTGTGVAGTTIFSNVDFSNIGNADNEHVYNFQQGAVSGAQVSGSININNSVIDTFTDTGVYLENFAGALDFSFTNNVLRNNITTTACSGGNCNGDGIFLRADGTSRINAFVLNSTFENIDGIALTANPEGSSGARMDLNVAQNAFTAQLYGGTSHTNNGETAISLRNAQGNSTMNFRLFSNDIRNYTGELALGVVEVEGGDFTNTQGVIDVLYIYHANEGNGLQIFADGANSSGIGTTNFVMNVSMNGINVPVATPILGSSIVLQNSGALAGSSANANFLLTGNNLLASATGSGRRTVVVAARDANNVCSRIDGNTIAGGTAGALASVDMSYNGTGLMRLQGMAGSGNANAVAYLNANNTLAVSATSATNTNITSATCTAPTLPVGFPF